MHTQFAPASATAEFDAHCMGKWHLSGTDYFDTGIPAPGWDPVYWLRHANLPERTVSGRQDALTAAGHGKRQVLDSRYVLRPSA